MGFALKLRCCKANAKSTKNTRQFRVSSASAAASKLLNHRWLSANCPVDFAKASMRSNLHHGGAPDPHNDRDPHRLGCGPALAPPHSNKKKANPLHPRKPGCVKNVSPTDGTVGGPDFQGLV